MKRSQMRRRLFFGLLVAGLLTLNLAGDAAALTLHPSRPRLRLPMTLRPCSTTAASVVPRPRWVGAARDHPHARVRRVHQVLFHGWAP